VFAANAVGNTHRNTLSPRLSGKRMLIQSLETIRTMTVALTPAANEIAAAHGSAFTVRSM